MLTSKEIIKKWHIILAVRLTAPDIVKPGQLEQYAEANKN